MSYFFNVRSCKGFITSGQQSFYLYLFFYLLRNNLCIASGSKRVITARGDIVSFVIIFDLVKNVFVCVYASQQGPPYVIHWPVGTCLNMNGLLESQ